MLYNVFGKHETSPKSFIQLHADSPEDAKSEARSRGWTVTRVERAGHARRVATAPSSDDRTPEYGALWSMAMLLRVFGIIFAVYAVMLLGRSFREDNIPWLHEYGVHVPDYIVAILVFLIAFEVYVMGEAVAAFRHLVQNSWAWRRGKDI